MTSFICSVAVSAKQDITNLYNYGMASEKTPGRFERVVLAVTRLFGIVVMGVGLTAFFRGLPFVGNSISSLTKGIVSYVLGHEIFQITFNYLNFHHARHVTEVPLSNLRPESKSFSARPLSVEAVLEGMYQTDDEVHLMADLKRGFTPEEMDQLLQDTWIPHWRSLFNKFFLKKVNESKKEA